MTNDMTGPQAWNRRLDLGESTQAYHAFFHFRNLPTRMRSLDRAYTTCQVGCRRSGHRTAVGPSGISLETLPRLKDAAPHWRAWRKRFQWDARAADYDAYLETETREEHLEAIREMNTRHAAIARACQGKLIERLQTITAADLSPGQLIVWLEKASAIERLARGVPAPIPQERQGSMPVDLSGLDDDELDLLERLLEKAHAGPRRPSASAA